MRSFFLKIDAERLSELLSRGASVWHACPLRLYTVCFARDTYGSAQRGLLYFVDIRHARFLERVGGLLDAIRFACVSILHGWRSNGLFEARFVDLCQCVRSMVLRPFF